MGWRTQPGSAEAIVQQWAGRKKFLGVFFLWVSVLYSSLFVWAGFEALKPEWRGLVLLPLAYGTGAGIMAEVLRRDANPSRLEWSLAVFFALLPLMKMLGDSGVFSIIS
jgi:hypothetical protein